MKQRRQWARLLALALALATAAFGAAACGTSGATSTTTAAAAETTAAAAETTAAPETTTTTTAAKAEETTTAAAETTAAAVETQAPPTEKVKVRVYNKPQDDDAESSWTYFEWYTQKVEEHFPDIEFTWDRLAPGTDYRQQLDQLLAAGEGPNFGVHFPYVDIKTRAANGTIAEITKFVESWDQRNAGNITTIFDNALYTNGGWYAAPAAPYVSGIVYNSTIIKEADGDPSVVPQTWSEFAELASQYTDKDIPRFGYLLLGSDFNAWTYTPWVWSAGGEMVRDNGDGTWEIAFNEDPGVDAALFMNELIWKYNATQKDVLESYDDMQNHFKMGQACYTWNSPMSFSADDLAKYDLTQEGTGFFPLPGKDEGGRIVGFAGGEVFTVSPISSEAQAQAGWDWYNYTYNDEEFCREAWALQDSLGTLSTTTPPRNDLVEVKFSYASNWPSHWKTEMANVLSKALPEPYCPHWDDLKNEIVGPLQTIYLKEGITFDEAKQILEDCANVLYEKYPDAFRKP